MGENYRFNLDRNCLKFLSSIQTIGAAARLGYTGAMRRFLFFILLMLAACQQPTASIPQPPTAVPFPTMTPGRTIRGFLPTVVALSLDGNLANPATAVALANRPTATPNYSQCPPAASPDLSGTASTADEMADSISDFLSFGGSSQALETALREDWGVLGESGAVQTADLTGEGSPDVLVTYLVPGAGGALQVLGCANGRYITYHHLSLDSIPQIIYAADMNVDSRADILYASQQCPTTSEADCTYNTQLLTWRDARFTSLLDGTIVSQNLPEIADVDNDRVLEIVVRMTSSGTPLTGPLRTGVTIYDWNGITYTRSITQLDPPRFRIQVLQQADRNLNRGDTRAAIALYEEALNNESLDNWFNDDPEVLRSYAFYRLLTTYAFTEDEGLLPTFQMIQQLYPDPANAPIFAQLSNAFWNALQVTGNLRSACLEVHDIIRAQPDILERLNRYGERGPQYAVNELCPF